MTAFAVPISRARLYVRIARTDSLVRNSLFMMTSTVATSLLGYVFWIIAARVFSSTDVGIASAVISLCSTVALLTYLGPSAMLIERLHAYERSSAWTSHLTRMCVATAVATGVVAAVAIPVVAHSKGYGSFFGPAAAAMLAVVGAVACTVVNMYGSAFIAARRADGLLAVQGLISVIKVLLVVPLCAVGLGASGIVIAWVVSSLMGVGLGALWLLPRLGLGGGRGRHALHGAAAGEPEHSASVARDSQPVRTRAAYASHLIGQHLTGVGGQLTPLVLPILVVLRLGVRTNAYFYITWMIGSVFFMVSPSISNALFAESVRSGSGLRATVGKAFRMTTFLQLPAIVVMVAGGKLILGIFGHAYADDGYGLLVVLAVSAMPDAVSNIAVAVCRATDRLGYSVAINVGQLVVTLCTAWLLMPRFGLLGVGVGWLGAQLLGAIASIPAFLNLGEKESVVMNTTAAIAPPARLAAPLPAQEGVPGRRRRRRDGTSVTVAHVRTFDEANALADEWRALYRDSAVSNPFAAPDWLLTWARHFVPERDLDIFTVWRDGALVGLAPWYVKRDPLVPRRLQLLGSGRHDALTELPQVLTAQGEARSVLRAVIGEWSQRPGDWGWLELPVMADQGWFEPEWLTGIIGKGGLVQHKTTRATVVLDLPTDVPALHAGLKRNLLESTHRARNRLDKSGRPWVITVHEDPVDIVRALSVLIVLHAARARLQGRKRHPDQLAVAARREFLREALAAMARRGQAQILTLDVAGRPVAAQLVLHGAGGSYLGLSGVDPEWWQASPVTLLQLRAAEGAVERGHREFNLSVGPSVSKLRWSEQIRQHPEFIVCGPRQSSRLAFTGYRMVAAAAGVKREVERHRSTGGRER
ncbi:MAG: GNAT family N-acetyltransferase [Trebonia sp.]|jgi:O-antigen/teichoic acid export membrane protein/CelD/BcsL family acetyltransferase involved in cellulose biosynthesis